MMRAAVAASALVLLPWATRAWKPNCTRFGTSHQAHIVRDEEYYNGYQPVFYERQYCDDSWRWDWEYHHDHDSLHSGCSDPLDSIGGEYCASERNCEIYFYKATSTSDQEQLSYQPSEDGCKIPDKSERVGSVIREKVFSWGDSCVGDFARCYSLAHHEAVFLRFFCSKEWEFPKGATHLSVNCTEDLQAKYKTVQRIRRRERRERIAGITITILLGLAGIVGLYFLRKMILRRMERAAKEGDGRDFTLCSFMACGYWFLIKKVASSTRWEREGLMRMHHRPEEQDVAEGTVEMESVATQRTAAVVMT